MAARRIDYRPEVLVLDGSEWPVMLTLVPLLTGGAGVGLMAGFGVDR